MILQQTIESFFFNFNSTKFENYIPKYHECVQIASMDFFQKRLHREIENINNSSDFEMERNKNLIRKLN